MVLNLFSPLFFQVMALPLLSLDPPLAADDLLLDLSLLLALSLSVDTDLVVDLLSLGGVLDLVVVLESLSVFTTILWILLELSPTIWTWTSSLLAVLVFLAATWGAGDGDLLSTLEVSS